MQGRAYNGRMSTLAIPFKKMNGLGNDFTIFDARFTGFALGPAAARRIADRRSGVGCDQVIIMECSAAADAFMRIFNADGSQVDACGNATRCVASLLAQETGRGLVSIETNAGVLSAGVNPDGSVTVDMGRPRFKWDEIPLAGPVADTTVLQLSVGPPEAPLLHGPSAVNVGNPHCIFWVEDVDAHDLGLLGPELETNPLFPERANISLAQVTSRRSLTLRVWERGAGLTKACGTAACAAAVAAARKGLTADALTVTLPGGALFIEWRGSDKHILMTGPVAFEYESELAIDPERFDKIELIHR